MSDEALITLNEAAERLGVHYMTAYRYVRTGRLHGVREGVEWRVDPAEVAAMGQPRPGAPRGRRRRTDYRTLLEERLVAGDEAGAWGLIEQALTSSKTPGAVYLEMIIPAMRSIGERWATGELTVADEHQASAIAHRLVGRLGPQFVRPGRRRGTIVIGSAPGDQHGLPTAFLADLLREHSFGVTDLGANTPLESFVDAVNHADRLVAVGICVTSTECLAAVPDVVEAVRRATAVPMLVGGSALPDEGAALAMGADAGAITGDDAVAGFLALTARA